MTTTKNRTHRGFDIIETDSGYGARVTGTSDTIGLSGTYQDYKTLKALKAAISQDIAYYRTICGRDYPGDTKGRNV